MSPRLGCLPAPGTRASARRSDPRARLHLERRAAGAAALALLACLLASCREGPSTSPPPAGAIAGRITEASTGRPVAGARVETVPATRMASTDGSGAYALEGLEPGSYAITASGAGFEPAVGTAVVTEDSTARLDLVLSTPAGGAPAATGSVTGLVTLPEGRPVPAGTRVELLRDASVCGADGTQVAGTDAGGRYLAQGLPGGAYLACARTTIDGLEFDGRSAFTVEAGRLSRADVVLQGPPAPGSAPSVSEPVVSLGDTVSFTFTVVADGFGPSTGVVVADTLPLLDDPAGPPGPGDRDGGQAFRYLSDRPTFDPDGIRYYVDAGDDDGGTATDYCVQSLPADPAEFPAPALCQSGSDLRPNVTLPSIAAARDSAEAASARGDQLVVVEYFDAEILARTPPEGELEAEDSFEIAALAVHSVNEFRLPGGALPGRDDENGEWCNIVTATSAEDDFVARSSCTRVVAALLELRKTALDALIPAGSQAEFALEIGNVGSTDLEGVTVIERLDPGLDLVREEALCGGCTIEFGADSSVLTLTIPRVPPTDDPESESGEPPGDGDGVLDDAEGFLVARLVTRAPLEAGTFCNRAAASDPSGRSDADVACVATTAEIEFDVRNVDARRGAGGDLEDLETFQIGDTVVYLTSIRNNSGIPATSVSVVWEIGAESGLLRFLGVEGAPSHPVACDPAGGPTGSGRCALSLDNLPPGESILLSYRTLAQASGNDVNRIRLEAEPLGIPVLNEEPTAVRP